MIFMDSILHSHHGLRKSIPSFLHPSAALALLVAGGIGAHAQSPARFTKSTLVVRDFWSRDFVPMRPRGKTASPGSQRLRWKTDIVTTVFWIGELTTANNPVSNMASSWNPQWQKSYGGFDDPARRKNYLPAAFAPRLNPFYCALPYNDVEHGKTKLEAAKVIPWFREKFTKPGVSVCRDRWVAIRKGGKTVYAQWSDCGPFRTDHFQYVFGNERPKPNLNHGAGLDVSPAVRDYLNLDGTDVTDWRFVEVGEVPFGPWTKCGMNNDFVINQSNLPRRLAGQ